jgi:hypothetical protein
MILGITLIVKNESEKIIETLVPFIEYGINDILIIDTGSEDDTCDKIKSLSDKIIIENSTFDGFDNSRNLALKISKEKFNDEVKFILMVDVEWYAKYIDYLVKFCQLNVDSEADIFYINLYLENNISNKKPCLFKRDGNGYYRGKLHETPVGKEGKIVPKFHFLVFQTETGLDKTRKRNKEFDIPFYLNKGKSIKYDEIFHLAQAYHNIKDYNNAVINYLEVVNHDESTDKFRYIASYRIGEIGFITNNIVQSIIGYSEANIISPSRCEPLFKLTQLNDGFMRYKLIKNCCNINIPTDPTDIFVEVNIYEIYRYYELANTCHIIGKYKEGKEALKKYFQKVDENHHLYKNAKELEEKLSKKIVVLILTSPGYELYNSIMTKYMENYEFDFYFYQFSEMYDEITTINHNIYIPGVESKIPGILDKTLKVFKMFENYDYIVRINSTSIVNFTKVIFNKDYWGYLNSTKLNVNDEFGVTKEFLERIGGNLEFVSGKCICLSKTAVNIILNSKIDLNVMDDIAIALLMRDNYKLDLESSFSRDFDNNQAILIACTTPEIMTFVIDYVME